MRAGPGRGMGVLAGVEGVGRKVWDQTGADQDQGSVLSGMTSGEPSPGFPATVLQKPTSA